MNYIHTIEPIGTAVLSYGMSGEVFHCPLLQAHPGFRLRTIVERARNKSSVRYPSTHISRSVEDALSNPAVELVVVNTPHDTHALYTRLALEAGKHVIVEKPFTTTVEEGMPLIELAQRKGRMLSVFHNRRWDGDFMTVQKVIRSGALGRLVEFESHYDRYRPTIDSATWKERKGAGVSILYNLGSHIIDQVLCLFGAPQQVTAFTGIQRTGGEVDDFYDIRLHYAGSHVILKSSYLVREEGPRYRVLGEAGTFTKYGIDPQEQALKDGHLPGEPGWGREDSVQWGVISTTVGDLPCRGTVETIAGDYSGYYDTIYRHLREGEPLTVTAHDGLEVIRIIEAAEKSSREGRTIPL